MIFYPVILGHYLASTPQPSPSDNFVYPECMNIIPFDSLLRSVLPLYDTTI